MNNRDAVSGCSFFFETDMLPRSRKRGSVELFLYGWLEYGKSADTAGSLYGSGGLYYACQR